MQSSCFRSIVYYSARRFLHLKHVPNQPVTPPASAATKPQQLPEISEQLVQLLERLSLVNFGSSEAVERLREAIVFADQIRSVDTSGIEPLFTVLEDVDLPLREDKVCLTQDHVTYPDAVLMNAAVKEFGNFVAPPGNIPLSQSASKTHSDNTERSDT